ncbi:hypothetical protein B0I35DRAFT_417394 [Stachybotrys elegans]|uniref:Secreted protein n=1 Tax=Stachybotrys elegans TaxID=80388 RepID=A0A8K0T789_9HYPO|nr:hypothetical protein B0I35DRAFT_417394 [Stachybotrys elegans]
MEGRHPSHILFFFLVMSQLSLPRTAPRPSPFTVGGVNQVELGTLQVQVVSITGWAYSPWQRANLANYGRFHKV